MRDYREVLEKLNLVRGTKSASSWMMDIANLECNAQCSDYVEYKPYETLILLKKELLKKTGPISHKFIRSFIKSQIESYDEQYIGKVGQLLSMIEIQCLENCQKQQECKFLNEMRTYINI